MRDGRALRKACAATLVAEISGRVRESGGLKAELTDGRRGSEVLFLVDDRGPPYGCSLSSMEWQMRQIVTSQNGLCEREERGEKTEESGRDDVETSGAWGSCNMSPNG